MPPLHPVLVHIPLAILPLGLLLEFTALITRRDEFSRVAWWVQVVGTIGLLAATVSGLATQPTIAPPHEALQRTLDNHQTLAFLADVCFAGLLFWRIGRRTKVPPDQIRWFLLCYGVGVALLLSAGLFGGELVYSFGVGISR